MKSIARQHSSTWSPIFLLATAIFLAVFFSAAKCAFAFSPLTTPLPASMGPLHNLLLQGTDGAWTGTMDRDSYALENTTDPGDIHYVYLGVDSGNRTVSCKVAASGKTEYGAGLLYAFHEDPLRYYAYVLTPEGKVRVFRRDADGFQHRLTLSRDSIHADAPNELRIVDRDGVMEFLVNDESIATIETMHAGLGGVGIIAIGVGRFNFSNFNVQAD